MKLLHRIASVLGWTFRRGKAEARLNDELHAYVEMAAAEKMRAGLPSDQAYRLARIELGGVEQVKERVRTERHGHLLDEVGRDVRYAVRMFASQRGFTMVLLVTLALGIGANTAIFSLIDALMLRTLPVPNSHELVLVNLRDRTTPDSGGETLSYAIVRALGERRDIFAAVGGFTGSELNVGPAGSVQIVHGGYVTGDFYATMGLVPAAGRLLTREDDERSAEPVAVLSDSYWDRQHGRAGSAIGQTLIISGKPVRIVGVTPPGFSGANVGSEADVTLPVAALPQLTPAAAEMLSPGNFWLRVLARPAPNVSVGNATSRLNAIWPELSASVISRNWPDDRRASMAAQVFVLEPGATGWTFLRELYAKPLFVLMAVAGLVLLIACANIASLVLARASTRQPEIAVRLAIGAGRPRIVRQLIIEGVVLSVAGAALGISVAWVCGRLVIGLMSTGPFPIAFDLTPNWHVIAFSSALAALTGIVFGLAPALQLSRTPASLALKRDERTGTARSRLLSTLVAVQVALSLVLVGGAGLFVRTLVNLRHVNSGFIADQVLVVRLERGVGPTPDRLLDVVRRVPGVMSAGVGTHTPLDGSSWSEAIVPVGQPMPKLDNARIIGVGPDFLESLQIPFVAGRGFTTQDVVGAPSVAIVNQQYADRFFPKLNPIGEHLVSDLMGQTADLEIVGVVRNTSASSLRRPPPAIVYVPFAQFGSKQTPNLLIRARGSIGHVQEAVREALQSQIPTKPVRVSSLSGQVDATILRERLVALLASGFGVIALMLSSIGLYGLLAYTVARRSREIGIRMALGASATGVVRLVVLNGARLVAIGLLVGGPAVWAASRSIAAMLFGLTPTDPIVMATASGLLIAAGGLASYLPARRAARVDPLVALRHE